MKKNLLYLCMLMFSLSLFTACSDDEKYPIDNDIAGAYKGKMDVCQYTEVVDDGDDLVFGMTQKVYISKASDASIKLSLKNFAIAIGGSELLIGDITVDKCNLQKKGEIYHFSGNQMLNILVGRCETSVKGTIEDGVVDMTISVNALDQGLKVAVFYKGDRLSGNENAEAKIESFSFDNVFIVEQPVIDEKNGIITFKTMVDENLKLKPLITLSSDKAIISPKSDIEQDFSNGKTVVYTVEAEDGTVKKYSVFVEKTVLKFSFEKWQEVKAIGFISWGYDKPQPINFLATSTEGAALMRTYGLKNDMPVYKTDDKVAGDYAIKLVTKNVSSLVTSKNPIPALIAGSLYTGKFSINTADQLSSTKFGISYDRIPLRFRGWYKYVPGTNFVDATDRLKIVEIPGKIDECAIQAVLYKVSSATETLTGHDINTSDKRVAIARLADGTRKDTYTFFDLPFEYLEGKTYEKGAMYKIAIVCSSSKEGDAFKGAGESTLWLDELEIVDAIEIN